MVRWAANKRYKYINKYILEPTGHQCHYAKDPEIPTCGCSTNGYQLYQNSVFAGAELHLAMESMHFAASDQRSYRITWIGTHPKVAQMSNVSNPRKVHTI